MDSVKDDSPSAIAGEVEIEKSDFQTSSTSLSASTPPIMESQFETLFARINPSTVQELRRTLNLQEGSASTSTADVDDLESLTKSLSVSSVETISPLPPCSPLFNQDSKSVDDEKMEIRRRFRQLTADILAMDAKNRYLSRSPGENTSKLKSASVSSMGNHVYLNAPGSTEPQTPRNPSNNGSTSPSDPSRKPPRAEIGHRKFDWDEFCLGLWIQDKQARNKNQSGRCLGIEVVKTDNPDGNIDDIKSLNRTRLLFVLATTKQRQRESKSSELRPPPAEPQKKQGMSLFSQEVLEKQLKASKKAVHSFFDQDRLIAAIDVGRKCSLKVLKSSISILENSVTGFFSWFDRKK